MSKFTLTWYYHISSVIRTIPKIWSYEQLYSSGLYGKGKAHLAAEFHKAELDILDHAVVGKTLFYSQVDMVNCLPGC